jgi:hypothetical protein
VTPTRRLSVWSGAAYPSGTLMEALDQEQAVPLQETFHAIKLIKAAKGDPIKGYAWIPVPFSGTDRKKLQEQNKDDIFDWFKESVRAGFRQPGGQYACIPVPPNDATTPGQVRNSRVWRLAKAAAEGFKSARPSDAIVWKRVLGSARKGQGTRDASVILEAAKVDRDRIGDAGIVLIDDVVTSGGHLVGCALAIKQATGRFPLIALTVGRTFDRQLSNPFGWEETVYELAP